MSKIEWTDATWNPFVGCSLKSPGCTNCYAMAMARRHELMSAAQDRVSPYAGLTKRVNGKTVWTGEMRLVETALTLPLRWTKPRRIFVNSMSDLFHEDVPDAWIDRVFAVMALCPQHTFQVLTKRSDRMLAYCTHRDVAHRIAMAAGDLMSVGHDPHRNYERAVRHPQDADGWLDPILWNWPLSHVWLGVSAEDQRRWDERTADLEATPAAVRFVSAEPLLGAIDPHDQFVRQQNGFAGRIHWIIVGGESGPGARQMLPDWARQIRDACAAAGVAFHFKQHGVWLALSQGAVDERDRSMPHQGTPDGHDVLYRVGKKAAGRLLDGVEHNGFPEVRHG